MRTVHKRKFGLGVVNTVKTHGCGSHGSLGKTYSCCFLNGHCQTVSEYFFYCRRLGLRSFLLKRVTDNTETNNFEMLRITDYPAVDRTSASSPLITPQGSSPCDHSEQTPFPTFFVNFLLWLSRWGQVAKPGSLGLGKHRLRLQHLQLLATSRLTALLTTVEPLGCSKAWAPCLTRLSHLVLLWFLSPYEKVTVIGHPWLCKIYLPLWKQGLSISLLAKCIIQAFGSCHTAVWTLTRFWIC